MGNSALCLRTVGYGIHGEQYPLCENNSAMVLIRNKVLCVKTIGV